MKKKKRPGLNPSGRRMFHFIFSALNFSLDTKEKKIKILLLLLVLILKKNMKRKRNVKPPIARGYIK
ncbi:MAG: hypothetical protein KBG43_09810, partial [Paludibacteraceae bacterium]|nr:hypothetical protein [Paludibacteraceae bacterium]